MSFEERRGYYEKQVIEHRRRVQIHTTDHNTVIQGIIFCGEGSEFDGRLSDLLNDPRAFIPVTDVSIFFAGKLMTRNAFMCINKQAIAFVIEIEEAPIPQTIPQTIPQAIPQAIPHTAQTMRR
ncbi:hypothetical protein [Neosynechococcus sphagnicola]|uniref:DUF6812 domain-containing protein n=1 Tax=Neosynechococcus sphagnicola TaxID=1501145 RepID=UPI0012E0098A|nr:hypothetical protein [Neosynechococcus sphagnicola]